MTGAKVVDLFESLKRPLEDAPPRVGKLVICDDCGRKKKPIGRDSMDNGLCDSDCPGYDQYPRPDTLWPGETTEKAR